MSKLLPLFLIVCISTVAQAASVYRWVDSDGQIHYSDLPSAGSEAVELRESSVYTPRELPDINREEEAEPTGEEAEPTDEGALNRRKDPWSFSPDWRKAIRSGFIWTATRLPGNCRPPRLHCRMWSAAPTH